MADICPVVRIRVAPCAGNPEGIVEINESDFDPAKHRLADANAPELPLAPPQPGAQPDPAASGTAKPW